MIGVVAVLYSNSPVGVLWLRMGKEASSGRCVVKASSREMRRRETSCRALIVVMSFVQEARKKVWFGLRGGAEGVTPFVPTVFWYIYVPVWRRWSLANEVSWTF